MKCIVLVALSLAFNTSAGADELPKKFALELRRQAHNHFAQGAAKSGSGRTRSDRQRPAAECTPRRPFLSEHTNDNRFRYYKGR
jgi:hypothetical protein